MNLGMCSNPKNLIAPGRFVWPARRGCQDDAQTRARTIRGTPVNLITSARNLEILAGFFIRR
jgi:hypothetical protein